MPHRQISRKAAYLQYISIKEGVNGGKNEAIRIQVCSGCSMMAATNIIGKYGTIPTIPCAPPEWTSFIAAPTVAYMAAMRRYPNTKYSGYATK